ncbi:MAG: translesion error-prone DNA polymerase V autoproteolytic subunit [Desulfovibrio sp.]|nr:translesion error-prone DNA polymerase V autoproteolytic subunit [Desulfovibrio sp.]
MNNFKPLSIVGVAAPEEKDPPLLPLYLNPVQAGWPSPAEDYIDSEINLHELIVSNSAATFFLRAAGDSMIECGIHDGDLLVVDRSREALHNRVVIAAVDGELLVKRLQRRGKRTFLAPANPEYPDLEITNLEYVHIWGVVTYVIHKL